MSAVILYDYWRSSASYRVRIALNLAGIAYESVPVDLLKGDHKSPEHIARNPQGLVPALMIDGVLLTQSLAIIEYLNETVPTLQILPGDPIARARVRAIAHAIAIDIHPVCNLGVINHVIDLVGNPDETRRVWMKKFIGPGLAAVEQLLENSPGPLSFGATPTLADICLIPQIYNARRWEVDLSATPRITAIEAALTTNLAFAAACPSQPI
jgi:maleylacetoacetate isomerase